VAERDVFDVEQDFVGALAVPHLVSGVPDVEVTIAPHDWAAGRDPQLDTAVRLALQVLDQRTPAAPPTI
jgi:hypothetical protein